MQKRTSELSAVDQLLGGIADIRRRLRELEALAVRLRKLEQAKDESERIWLDTAFADAARVREGGVPVQALAGDEPPRILVVEDEEVIRDLLRKVGEGLGCEVVEAERGRDALDLMEKAPIHLMLLDLHLPGGDGLELLKVLRRRGMRVPTIIVTAFISTRVAQEAKQLGVNSVVAKPFRMDRIAGEIQRVLGGGGLDGAPSVMVVDDGAHQPEQVDLEDAEVEDRLTEGLDDLFEEDSQN